MPSNQTANPPSTAPERLPWSPLLALGTAVFITSLTETLPAGVLSGMSAGLDVSESAMGQSITLYAIGTALTAVPLSAVTAHWRRKRLLVAAMIAFLAANTFTALAPTYTLAMGARFIAGVAAGVAWSLLAGYARRIAPEHLAGRAIAVAMTGIPLALSLGVPLGTFVGQVVSWRAAFGLMSVLTIAAVAWIWLAVADVPGAPHQTGDGERRPSILWALTVSGVPAVLVVTLVVVLAHTLTYAYIAAYLADASMTDRIDLVLLLFGVACLASIWVVGRQIDHELRSLTVGSVVLLAGAMLVFVVMQAPVAVYMAAVAWGLGWGGVPTLLQTAGVSAAGRHSDAAVDSAQSMLVTLWNAAMALGGILGGVLLSAGGALALPGATALLSVPALLVVLGARRHGFPRLADPPRAG